MLTGTRLMKKFQVSFWLGILLMTVYPFLSLRSPKGTKATKFSGKLRPSKSPFRIFYHSSEEVGFFTDKGKGVIFSNVSLFILLCVLHCKMVKK